MDFLAQQVGPLTVGQWIGAVVAISLIKPILGFIKGLSGGSSGENMSAANCLVCGWEGKVSKYHRTCPKCGNQITRLQRGET